MTRWRASTVGGSRTSRPSSSPALALADCAAEVARAAEAGAELIQFTTLFDQAAQAERLAAEVIPRLN